MAKSTRPMPMRRLGRSNLRVSALCVGTMMFGDRTDEAESRRIVDAAREAGVNFIDTADVYARGESERITGRCIAKDRHDWVLATKVGNAMGEGANEKRYSRVWIERACEASLERLGTDHIDIYYLHVDFPDGDLEEPLRAAENLVRAGKIRYLGISNFRGWRIAETVRICERINAAAPVVLQPYYNLLNRGPEVEILPACDHYGLGVVPYSPIARGVLTGKYEPGTTPPPESRVGRADRRMMETEFRTESLAIAQTLKAHAAKRNLTLGQFATAWVLGNQIVSSVIAGPRTLEQWRDYPGAVGYTPDADDEALVDSLVSPGHPSTPGFNDPQYPFFGRRTSHAAR
jgi:aryl-alcohol dehydrogenase-like predicted oxidoreductase